jgi:CDP-glucose 4,6-dehydratase
MFNNIFKNKTVLITGHTGFKGSWLSLWLNYLGAKVVGLSVDVPSVPSNFDASSVSNVIEDYRIDIRDAIAVKLLIDDCQPDFLFHLAAQALVIPSYNNPLETLSVNALGTANVLDALRTIKKEVIAVMITSDKVYNNVEWVWGYRETDSIGGKDPYSASKGMAELAIKSYIESFFNNKDSNVRIGIARAGNVIGGGDWAENRLVPDCIKAWSNSEVVDIRNPFSTRPWQHVLEPISGYITLASLLLKDTKYHGEEFNFGPSANQDFPVSNLIDEMSQYWTKVKWRDISKSSTQMHEAGLLKLNCDKALFELNWLPTLRFEETVRMTVEWYKNYYQNKEISMFEYSLEQIEEYILLANARSISWSKDD